MTVLVLIGKFDAPFIISLWYFTIWPRGVVLNSLQFHVKHFESTSVLMLLNFDMTWRIWRKCKPRILWLKFCKIQCTNKRVRCGIAENWFYLFSILFRTRYWDNELYSYSMRCKLVYSNFLQSHTLEKQTMLSEKSKKLLFKWPYCRISYTVSKVKTT